MSNSMIPPKKATNQALKQILNEFCLSDQSHLCLLHIGLSNEEQNDGLVCSDQSFEKVFGSQRPPVGEGLVSLAL